MTNLDRPILVKRTFASAIALAAALALSACAHDANSRLASGALDAADSDMSIVDLGKAAAARGDHMRAIQYFRSAHARNLAYSFGGSNPEALTGLAASLMAIGQYGEASKVFVKAVDSGGGAPALRGLAQTQLTLRQPGLAVESARRAMQLDPNDARSMALLGVALDVLGDHQGAMSIYTDASSRFPGSLSIAGNHGLSMVMAGDVKDGVSLLENVVRDPRATARDRQNLAIGYALSGDYNKAAALAAIDLDVTGVRANMLYADMLRAMSPRARFASLVSGTQAAKTDYSQNANAVFLKGDNAAWVEDSIRRLVPVGGEATDIAGVPPLMDPTGWAVQIAAYRKLEHLAPGWAYLSSKYASIIGGLEPRRSEVTHPSGSKGPVGHFFRLNAGPLRSKAEAVEICNKLKAVGAECWVRPPTAGEGRLPDGETLALNAKSNAAESAILASGDYNAVVNQFARALVTKGKVAPPKPQPQTVPTPPEVVPPAPPKPAPAEQMAEAQPAAKLETVAQIIEAAPLANRSKPMVQKAKMVPKPKAAAAPIKLAALTPAAGPKKPEPATIKAFDFTADVLDSIAYEFAVLEPAAGPPQPKVPMVALAYNAMEAPLPTPTPQPEAEWTATVPQRLIVAQASNSPRMEALQQVFDAVDEAEQMADVQKPKPQLPVTKRFNGASSAKLRLMSSGTLTPEAEQSGKPVLNPSPVFDGVY